MYDSRTHKPRIPGTHRYSTRSNWGCSYYCCDGKERMTDAEAIAEGLAEMQPEYVPERWDINRLHVEALREDEQRWNDLQDEAWAWFDEQERLDDDRLHYYEEYDEDDAWVGSWMPVLTMTEAREHFGPDFEHNGFQIDSTNAPRRTYRKAPTMHDYERAEALMATQKQRLAALMPVDEKAKVTRALPVPHAERPEPAPYDKFAGVYNEALDPISPNFDRSAW